MTPGCSSAGPPRPARLPDRCPQKERGWELESDATYYDLAVRYLSKEHVPLATGFDAPLAASDLQHVIIARRRAN